MFRHWDSYMTEKGSDAGKALPKFIGVSSYWGASLYVVIEGWEKAQFNDPIIDALLGLSNYKDVLRKLRNGTFHYQPSLISPKIVEFFTSHEVVLWLHFIHQEFCRWLRDHVAAVERELRSQEEKHHWRQSFAELIGWLPLKPAEKELESLRELVAETTKELDASGSDSEEAKKLRDAIRGCDTAASETAEKVRLYRRARLEQFGLNPDLVP
jgi:hypothetical protein